MYLTLDAAASRASRVAESEVRKQNPSKAKGAKGRKKRKPAPGGGCGGITGHADRVVKMILHSGVPRSEMGAGLYQWHQLHTWPILEEKVR